MIPACRATTASASSPGARWTAACSAACCARQARAGAAAAGPREGRREAPRRSSRPTRLLRRAGRASPPTSRSPGCSRSPVVTAPIIGPRTIEQLDGGLRALEITLDDDDARSASTRSSPARRRRARGVRLVTRVRRRRVWDAWSTRSCDSASTRSPAHRSRHADLIDEVRDGRGARARHGLHLRALQRQGGGHAVGRGRRGVATARHRHRGDEPQHPPPDRHRVATRRRCTASPAAASPSGSAAASTAVRRDTASRAITTAQIEDFAGTHAPALAGRGDPRPRRPGRAATRSCTSTRRSTRTSRSASWRSARTRSRSAAGRSTRSCCTRSSPTRPLDALRRDGEDGGGAGRPRPRRGEGLVVLRHGRRPPARDRCGSRRPVGRLATYLQGYGDLLVRTNGWDPAVLERFRADPFVPASGARSTQRPTTEQLEHVATLIPDEWLAPVGDRLARRSASPRSATSSTWAPTA